MNDLISIIVPIYNVESYLTKCIESIINQTYKKLEIILVDDGSPDNCGRICDDYAKKDNRVVVIHKQNGGLSDARNAGIEIMKGQYVGFVDSDDWIEPDMYEILLRNLKKFNAEMSFGGVADDLVTDGGVTTVKVSDYGKEPFAESERDAMKRYFCGSWAAWDKLYKAELFEDVRYPVGEINEDEAIVLQLLSKCNRVCYTNQIFYHYMKRENSKSITSTGWNRKKLAWCDHCEKNMFFTMKNYEELVLYARQRYCSSLIWALNNMTENPKEYLDLIPHYRKKLQNEMKKRPKVQISSKKEKIRAYALVYCFNVYSIVIQLMDKHYT